MVWRLEHFLEFVAVLSLHCIVSHQAIDSLSWRLNRRAMLQAPAMYGNVTGNVENKHNYARRRCRHTHVSHVNVQMQVPDVRWYGVHCVAIMTKLVRTHDCV